MGSLPQRRVAVAIVIATLLITSLFFAQGTTRLLAATVLDLETETSDTSARPSTRARSAGPASVDSKAILRRNIFDSALGPLDGSQKPPPSPDDAESTEDFDENNLGSCDGSVRLVGTLVNTRRPEWSFASITSAAGKAKVYRAGSEIDGRTVLAIHRNTVVLRPSAGGPCELAMFDPERAAPARPARSSSAASVVRRRERPAREGAISTAELDSGITKSSDTGYTVSRSLVDKLLENQSELMRTARIIPHQEGGRTVGIKLYGIRRNSLLGKLGLQNGDMLRTINGFDMASPDRALEAYTRLRSADNLTVSIVRRGEPMSFDYNIQ